MISDSDGRVTAFRNKLLHSKGMEKDSVDLNFELCSNRLLDYDIRVHIMYWKN